MNADCMIVHMEYYTDPFSIRHQLTKGFGNPIYEVWEEDGEIKHRTVERMSGIQVFSYPEFIQDFALMLET